jgi:hypothetical protein
LIRHPWLASPSTVVSSSVALSRKPKVSLSELLKISKDWGSSADLTSHQLAVKDYK